MTQLIQLFLQEIENLRRKNLTYRQPGDGSDGTCDCIGLIIGALRRMGIKWPGIHGSNYAARRTMASLKPIDSINSLKPGDIVYKACEKSNPKWTLSKYKRYLPGGVYYNGDLKDYYHVGVVTSVNPLQITHMTAPTVKVDTTLGKWNYYGQLKLLSEGKIEPQPVSAPVVVKPEPVATGVTATVTAPSGKYVKMRQQPDTRCRLYDEVPIGAKVTLVKPGETWAQICYGHRKNWYMMAKFLDV